MAFARFEDFTGRIELLVFSNVLLANPELWQAGKVLVVKGKVRSKDGEAKLMVDEAKELKSIAGRANSKPTNQSNYKSHLPAGEAGITDHESRIINHESTDIPFIDPVTAALELRLPNPLTQTTLAELKKILSDNPGDTTITFLINKDGETIRQLAKSTVRISQPFVENLCQLIGADAIKAAVTVD